jgi:hypothetical protein
MVSRRTVLQQLAAIPITAALAGKLQAQTANKSATLPNLILFGQNNGTKRGAFWPTAPANGGSIYPIANTPILSALFTNDGKTDNGIRTKTNIFKGLTVTASPGGNGNQHDNGFGRMFTGAKLTNVQGAPYGNAISIDQIMANDWKVTSLTTAVYSSEPESHPKAGFDHRQSFSYLAPTKLNLPVIDPLTAFNNTFPQSVTGTSASAVAARQRVLLRQSVLDSVTGDLTELQGRLGADDAQKLDFHLTAIRDVENQLSKLMNGGGACTTAPMQATAPWYSPSAKGSAIESSQEQYNDQMVQFFASLIIAAIQCGQTRVASFQFGYGGGKWKFGWLAPPININHHDDIAHHDTQDAVGNEPTSSYVIAINQYYASIVRKVAVALNATPSGPGTLLDNTLIVWGNELGRGDHQLTDVPFVLIGLVGNGIKAGNRLIDMAALRGSQQPHVIFGYHVLNALGHSTPGWGDIADLTSTAVPNF